MAVKYATWTRNIAGDIPSIPPEPIEYTYTFPTGKQLHIEVSGNGYTTLSTNVTMTADKTVTADLINGTITGGDVAPTVTLTMIVQSIAGAMYGSGTGTVNSESFTSNGSSITPSTFTVNAGESCTITAVNPSSSKLSYIHINGTMVADEYGTSTYTFTPTEDCTIGINFCIEK